MQTQLPLSLAKHIGLFFKALRSLLESESTLFHKDINLYRLASPSYQSLNELQTEAGNLPEPKTISEAIDFYQKAPNIIELGKKYRNNIADEQHKNQFGLELNRLQKILENRPYNEEALNLIQALLETIKTSTVHATELEINITDKTNQIQQIQAQIEGLEKLYAETVASANTNLESQTIQINQKFQDRLIELDREYDKTKNQLESKIKGITKLEALVAGEKVSDSHNQQANSEGLKADFFRACAIVLMAVLAGYSLSVPTDKHVEFSIWSWAYHVIPALFISFLIAYLVRQAAVHRSQQQKHTQTALDLGAINPFLADMSDINRDDVKRSVAEKIFIPKDIQSVTDSTGYGALEMAAKIVEKVDIIRTHFSEKKDSKNN